jgi:hypothetical protein
MDRIHVDDARPTTPSACSVSAKSHTIKCTPKGKPILLINFANLTSASYVEMLENQQAQLVAGLQELYKRSQTGEGWIGSPLKATSHGMPLTHDILERLGALKQDGHSAGESFEEDLDVLQQRLIANGAGFMQRDTSSDSGSEDASSPTFDQPPRKRPSFTDPFALNRFPPTPPYQSPYLQTARTAGPSKSQTFARVRLDQIGMNPTLLQRQLWGPTPDDDNMGFINRFDSPSNFEAASSPFSQMQVPVGTINPAMSVRFMEEDFMLYNPTLI